MIKRNECGEYVTDEGAPCPFCRYSGDLLIQWRYTAWVECPNCHACGPNSLRGSQDPIRDALEYWNESGRHE